MPYGPMFGMPPAATCLCANCACRRRRRSSLRCASATYSGFWPAIFPFISVTARVASSAEENATNAEPRLREGEGGDEEEGRGGGVSRGIWEGESESDEY